MSPQLLSTSIALGRILVENPRRCYLSQCALGMALAANNTAVSYEAFFKLWPWAKEMSYTEAPCGCRIPNGSDAAGVIMHLFDNHVRGNPNIYREWTLEQVIDWVSSVEPPLPADPLEPWTPTSKEVSLGHAR